MDATVLIVSTILLALGALLVVMVISLRDLEPPRSSAGYLPAATRVRVVCPGTRLMTRIRIRVRERSGTAGLQVEECERFPGAAPQCREECLEGRPVGATASAGGPEPAA